MSAPDESTATEPAENEVDDPRLVRAPVNSEFEDFLSCPCCADGQALARNRDDWAKMDDPQMMDVGGAWAVICPCGLQTNPNLTERGALDSWNRRKRKDLNNDGTPRFVSANV